MASIVRQTFPEWELLLYDDGSDADYREGIREVSRMDARIRYIRDDENHGLAYALNQCLRASEGRYIARMDADDVSKPERLAVLYEFLERHPEYQWAGSNAELIDAHGVWGVEKMQEVPRKEDFLPYSPYIHPSVVFRKEVLMEMEGYCVSEETRRCEDYELFMRLHRAGYQGYNVQQPLLLYREDADAYRKRSYRWRVREMRVRCQGFRMLGILRPNTVPYVLRPMVGGLFSPAVQKYYRKLTRQGAGGKGTYGTQRGREKETVV